MDKRNTGRTTRMIFQAAMYLVANPDKRVLIVGATVPHIHELHSTALSLISADLIKRIDYQYYNHPRLIQGAANTFYDHFCFDRELRELKNKLESIQREHDAVLKESNLYDL